MVYPLSALTAIPSLLGAPVSFSLLLKEGGRGWLKDPQNSLAPYRVASKCDLIQVTHFPSLYLVSSGLHYIPNTILVQVLSRLSAVHILGDWTLGNETVALDGVALVNTKSLVPACAMALPDASICTC